MTSINTRSFFPPPEVNGAEASRISPSASGHGIQSTSAEKNWFSDSNKAQIRPIILSAHATIEANVDLDALANDVLSNIGYQVPD